MGQRLTTIDDWLNRLTFDWFDGADADQMQMPFSVDGSSGIVRTSKLIDREQVAKYELTVVAVDRGTPELSTSVPVTIVVDDINDSPPAFESQRIRLFIEENSPVRFDSITIILCIYLQYSNTLISSHLKTILKQFTLQFTLNYLT